MLFADFVLLSQTCAPEVHPVTMAAVATVESALHPYAIGVVRGQLVRQPANLEEAVATARMLDKAGFNFSMGLGQVNRDNLKKYELTYETVFDTCKNLRAASLILKECFDRARVRFTDEQQGLQAAFSCYYSGNFSTGFKAEADGQPSYVQKIVSRVQPAGMPAAAIPIAVVRTKSRARLARPVTTDETAAAMVFR